MGGKGVKKKGLNATPGLHSHVSVTLREESRGKKHVNVNAKTMCKLDHLKNLALWATSEASIPSLGAFFGERLAATTEALGIRADPSLFVCERCESVLLPGDNCTVRIEKNKSKMRHRSKKSNHSTRNNVVYRCHFCSHRNLMRGTLKGYLREICPPKPKPPTRPPPTKLAIEKHDSSAKATSVFEANKVDTVALPTIDGQDPETNSPATPAPPTCLSLLDAKRRKRNRSGAKKVVEPESIATTADAEKSKRRKKSWTSLKEIAENSEHDIGKKKLANLSIPFFI